MCFAMTNLVALLGDLFDLAEKKLGIPAEQLLRTARLSGLESMLAAFGKAADPPGPVEQAAACAAWIVCHQPFPELNREIAYAYMRLLLKQAEVPWPRVEEDAPLVEARLQALEAGEISEAEFVDWVCLRVATA